MNSSSRRHESRSRRLVVVKRCRQNRDHAREQRHEPLRSTAKRCSRSMVETDWEWRVASPGPQAAATRFCSGRSPWRPSLHGDRKKPPASPRRVEVHRDQHRIPERVGHEAPALGHRDKLPHEVLIAVFRRHAQRHRLESLRAHRRSCPRSTHAHLRHRPRACGPPPATCS